MKTHINTHNCSHKHMHAHAHTRTHVRVRGQILESVAYHARTTDTDMGLRQQLALQQAEDKVPQDCMVRAWCRWSCLAQKH